MGILKELKSIHWPKPKRIMIEYLAVLICVSIFSGIILGTSYLTMYLLSLI